VIVVSSCLAGDKVRYNGTACFNQQIYEAVKAGKAISVYPEVMGGCSFALTAFSRFKILQEGIGGYF
jgi:uncharacterized protein YbbK (DUF523 family)